jgi:hypothetical protein
MDFTAPQVWRGLAGFALLRDAGEDSLPLPAGDRDIPLMICDRSFEEDGSFRYPALDARLAQVPGVSDEYSSGVLGDVILVNGAPWPVLEVDAARYRLRVLNASNARRYQLALNPAAPLVQVGTAAYSPARPRTPRSPSLQASGSTSSSTSRIPGRHRSDPAQHPGNRGRRPDHAVPRRTTWP